MCQINASPEEQENVTRVGDQLLEAMQNNEILVIPCPRRDNEHADMLLVSAPQVDDENNFNMQVFARLFMNSREAYSEYLIPNMLVEGQGLVYDKDSDEYLKEIDETDD